MKTASFILIFLLSFLNVALGQQLYSLSGKVFDAETNESLIGVAVVLKKLNKGVTTNYDGAYKLELERGLYQISFSYIGYEEQSIDVKLEKNEILTIHLIPTSITTEEVVVSSQREDENIVKTVDHVTITQKEISKLPYLLGEVDPLKMLQLLPGVQSNGEGNNGIFVRGGAIDQNLILLDQTPVYNTGHLFGFFSLFNHSIIDNVNLIKGGIPANYGGRLSSVLEINTKSGDFQKFKGEGSIGIVSGNFALQGPIIKNKSSFILTGRRTYIDLLSKMLSNDPTIFNTGIDYYFDDLNARVDFKFSPKDRIAFSSYSGTDDFLFKGKGSLSNKIRWKNYTSSLRWDHFFTDKSYLATTAFASSYKMDFSARISDYTFNIHSSIKDYGLKTAWVIESVPNHKLTIGAEYVHHALIPNNIKASSTDIDLKFIEQEELLNQEQSLSLNDEIKISDKILLSAGLRLGSYQQLGPFTRYVSDESLTIVDTVSYKRNDVIKSYWNMDPRLSFTYRLNEQSSVKASFDRMHQYLHMAPISSVSLPTDVWVPSSEKLKPQQGTQYAVGYFQNFKQNTVETSITAYYKDMRRQIEYRDGVIVGYSKGFSYDDNFIFGKGKSYGLEVFIKKNKGDLTGWLSYTLSRTTRTFDDINQGRTFAAKYDRLHNFSWVTSYQLNDRWSFSGVFTYSTGNALTLPVGRYIINGNIINEYEGRNTFRMPAYHRMDFSATYHASKGPKFESFWVFSLYNVYNRKNPYYIYFETEGNVNDYYLKVSLEKVSLFPIIPSVAYQFKF